MTTVVFMVQATKRCSAAYGIASLPLLPAAEKRVCSPLTLLERHIQSLLQKVVSQSGSYRKLLWMLAVAYWLRGKQTTRAFDSIPKSGIKEKICNSQRGLWLPLKRSMKSCHSQFSACPDENYAPRRRLDLSVRRQQGERQLDDCS